MLNHIKSPAWAPIPLRLIVGFGFIEHGYAKLLNGPENFAFMLHALGVSAPHLMAWLTILTELLGASQCSSAHLFRWSAYRWQLFC
jgi:uncharacterized membrane protein YphA (DoxX/SURF4 family)